jgi:hypothetical protein
MHPIEFIEWRKDFLSDEVWGVFYFDPWGRSTGDGALNRLMRLGVPPRPILEAILDVLPQIKNSPKSQRHLRSNERCHKDADILSSGTSSEKWDVFERWEATLRDLSAFKTVRIIFFKIPDGRRDYVVDRCIPGTRSFRERKLPDGARETEWIITKNYPRRELYEKLKIALSTEETIWLARQLRRIGQGKHGGRIADEELQECALNLEKLIKQYARRPCVREIGELLQAAFPELFNPQGEIGKATAHLIRRAKKRGVTARTYERHGAYRR